MNQKQFSTKELRRIGHDLKPVVQVSENGISENVAQEISRALADHELIKVKIFSEREDRAELIKELCDVCSCKKIQSIGKIALIYKPADKPKAHLSNIARFYAKA